MYLNLIIVRTPFFPPLRVLFEGFPDRKFRLFQKKRPFFPAIFLSKNAKSLKKVSHIPSDFPTFHFSYYFLFVYNLHYFQLRLGKLDKNKGEGRLCKRYTYIEIYACVNVILKQEDDNDGLIQRDVFS